MNRSTGAQFPATRLRRSRRSAASSQLVADSALGPGDLRYPMFALDGNERCEATSSLLSR